MTVYLLPTSFTYHTDPDCGRLAHSNTDDLRTLTDEHTRDPRLDACTCCGRP